MSEALSPCPFCGAEPKKDSWDRGISIGCGPCGYSRSFGGLLQSAHSPTPITQYKNDDGSIRVVAPENAKEFYHYLAHEQAAEAWNKRAAQ